MAGWTQGSHNSSRPLAVLLTLDRPSRNPESVILREAHGRSGVQQRPKDSRPGPLPSTPPSPDPAQQSIWQPQPCSQGSLAPTTPEWPGPGPACLRPPGPGVTAHPFLVLIPPLE